MWPGWLDALLDGAAHDAGHDVLGGPIRARLEGGRLHACGREPPPLTTLDLGPEDRDAEFVWGANMTLRRRALERIGPFDPRCAARATRRTGSGGCAPRAGASATSRPPGSTTAAPAPTPPSAG